MPSKSPPIFFCLFFLNSGPKHIERRIFFMNLLIFPILKVSPCTCEILATYMSSDSWLEVYTKYCLTILSNGDSQIRFAVMLICIFLTKIGRSCQGLYCRIIVWSCCLFRCYITNRIAINKNITVVFW